MGGGVHRGGGLSADEHFDALVADDPWDHVVAEAVDE